MIFSMKQPNLVEKFSRTLMKFALAIFAIAMTPDSALAANPKINGVDSSINISDKTSVQVFDSATVSADSDVTVTVTFSPSNLGGFQSPLPAGIIFTNNTYLIQRTSPSSATTKLQSLNFTPISNLITVPTTSDVDFHVFATDTNAVNSATEDATLHIKATNDAPTLTVGTATYSITDKQTAQPFSGVTVTDVDNSGNQPVTISIEVVDTDGGYLTVGSSGFSSNNFVYSYTGTPANATSAAHQLVFVPIENHIPVGQKETNHFNVTVTDTYASRSNNNIRAIVTSINDTPVIADLPTAHQPVQTGNSIQPFSITSLRDPDANDDLAKTNGQSLKLQIELSGANPLGNLQVGAFSGTTYVASNVVPSEATALLRSLIYRAPTLAIAGTNAITLTVTVTDSQNASTNGVAIADVYSVVSPAGLTGTQAGQRVNDNTTIQPFSTVSIQSFNGTAVTVKISLTNDIQGELINLSGFTKSTATSPAVYQFTGSSEAATAAIRSLLFRPAENRIDGSSTETTVFGITLIDGPLTNNTDFSTTVIVTPVNDAPTIVGLSPLVTISDVDTIAPFPTVLISEVDELGKQPLTVTVRLDDAAKGTFSTNSLAAAGFVASGANYVYTGTNATAAIRQLVFVPTPNRVPVGLTETTTFTVTLDDGHGGLVSNSSTAIRVASVSGMPVVTLPTPQPLSIPVSSNIFPFQLVNISDPGLLNMGVQIANTNYGFFTASSLAASGFTNRDNGLYTFSGTASNATAAIRQLDFAASPNIPVGGVITFNISVTNQVPNFVSTNLSIVLRQVQKSFIVTKLTDYDPDDSAVPESEKFGTLRKAIEDAGGNDHITFDIRSTVAGLPDYPATIRLKKTLVLNNNLVFDGPGAERLTINGDNDDDGVGDVQLFVVNAAVKMNRISFTKGHASFSGGAFFVGENGSLTLNYCAVTDNSADVWGGGIDVEGGVLNMDHCLIAGNKTGDSLGQGGGGVSIYTDQPCLIANTTFSGNEQLAESGLGGGALYVENMEPGLELDVAVLSCTFHENSDAANQGTSIRPNVFNTYVLLQNSILADGHGKNIDMDHSGAVFSLGGNISDDSTATIFSAGGEATNTIIFHPPADWTNTVTELFALANNGGPTLTYALAPTNAALNHAIPGNPADPLFSTLGTDQRGFFRNGQADIGAFELGASNRIIIEEIHFAPSPNANDEFIEFYVPRDAAGFDLAGYKVFVGGNLRHTFSSQFVGPGEAMVLFSHDASATTVPSGVYKQIADNNLLLDDMGGTITLINPSNQEVFSVSYVASFSSSDPNDPGYLTGTNQSLVLSPQFEGVFLPYQRVVAKEGGRIPGTNELSGAGYNVNGNPLAAGNAPPRAYADTVSTTAHIALTNISVLSNDVDLDVSDAIRVVGVGVTNGVTPGVTGSVGTSSLGAAIAINGIGESISYDPTASAFITSLPEGSNVVDTFQYTILDSLNGVDHDRGTDVANNLIKATATVSVNIVGVNSAPTPQIDDVNSNPLLTTAEDALLDFTTAANILANDTDPNSDDNSATLNIIAIHPTSVYSDTLEAVSELGATVSLDIRFDRDETHIVYDPKNSATLNALGAGQTAVDTVYYSVVDSHGAIGTAAIHITVTGVNDALTATADFAATDENTAITLPISTLLANDTDPDNGTALQIQSVTASSALGASVQIVGANVIYDPSVSPTLNSLARKEVVVDTFTYTAADGNGSTSNAVVSVTVTGVNDTPIGADDLVSTGEKELLGVSAPGVLSNDIEPDVNGVAPDDTVRTIPFANAATAAGALATMNADGSFSYDPRGVFDWLKEGETTNDTFAYTVMDHSFAIANNDLFAVRSGTTANILPVLANDSSLSQTGLTLSVTAVTPTSGLGTVSISAQNDAVLYTPAENFVGTETFTYTIADGLGGSDTAQVTVTTTGSVPKANADSFTVAQGSTANLDVLANDAILPPTGAALTITGVGSPNNGGNVSLNGTGPNNLISYTPNPSNACPFTETFSYQISGANVQATGIVTVTVINRTNTLPQNDDSFVVLAGGGNNVLDVLANDTILPGANTNLTIVGIQTNGVIGTVSLNTARTRIVYRPPTGVINHQEPLIVYTVSDGVGGTASANVSIEVRPSGFFAEDDVFSVMKNSATNSLAVMINDVILPSSGQTLYVTGLGIGTNAPNHNGVVSIDGAGKALVYTPAANFVGEETFTYEIADGTPARALGRVRVRVLDNATVNSNPDVYAVTRESSDNALAVLKNDYVFPRSPGDFVISKIFTNGIFGAVSLNGASPNNFILYTPAAGFIGQDNFGYEITDALGNKGTNFVAVNIGGLMSGEDQFTVLSDSTGNALNVLANDYFIPDVAGVRPISNVGTGDQGGIITTNATATAILYTSAPGFVGSEHFSYETKDDSGATIASSVTVHVVPAGSDRDTKTVTVTVVGTNDLPTIVGTQAGIQITDKQTVQPFANVTIADVDERGLQNLTTRVSFNSASGALTNLSGFVQTSSGVYTFHGIGSAVTAAIRNLQFVPVQNRIPVPQMEVTAFTVSVDDGYAANPVLDNVTTVEVTSANDAPTVSGTITGLTVYQRSSLRPFAGATVRDVDGGGLQPLQITVTISNPTNGFLSSLGSFSSIGNGSYRLSGVTAADASIALQDLVFVPTTADRVTAGAPETTVLTIAVEDSFAPPVLDDATSVIAIHEFIGKLLASDGSSQDEFGKAVATTRDVAVIGAALDDDLGANSGSAYIFTRQPGSPEHWVQTQKLTAPDGAAGDQFGTTVAISGETIVVGAPFAQGNRGAVYVYRRSGGSNSWTATKILPADLAAGDQFGSSVAIDGDIVVAGSRLDDDFGSESGSVYIFTRAASGTNNWVQTKKLTAFDGAANDHFGYAVGVSGENVVVGALDDVRSGLRIGSAYLYGRDKNGANNWGFIKKLIPSNGGDGDEFGAAVSIDGDNLVVGARLHNFSGEDTGGAYIFSRNQGGADNWGEVKSFVSSSPLQNNQMGYAVSISKDAMVTGLPFAGNNLDNRFGTAFLFQQDEGGASNWGAVQEIKRDDMALDDHFGIAVSVADNTIIVGAHTDDDLGNNSGSAYVYRIKFNNPPVLIAPIPDQTNIAGAAFNFSIPPRTFGEADVRDPLVLSTFSNGSVPGSLVFDPALNQFSGTMNGPGQFEIFVVATDEDGASVTNSFTLTVLPSYQNSLETWRSAQFGFAASDPGQISLWGDSADPDGDGANNLSEYLFGTNPNSSDDSGLQITQQPDGSFAISYNRRSIINYTLQISSDLVNWSSADGLIQSESTSPLDADLEAVTCIVPANAGGAGGFFRVVVSQ